MKIYNISGKVIFKSDADTRRQTVIDALQAGTDLSGADLAVLDLRDVDFRGAILRGADLSGSHLNGSNFYGADFSDAEMCGTNFMLSNICATNFARANLSGANFADCHINGVDFTGADLTSATFFWASLTDVCIKDAKLVSANFQGAAGIYLVGPLQEIDGQFVYIVHRGDGQEPMVSYKDLYETAGIFSEKFSEKMMYDRNKELYEQQIRLAIQLMGGQSQKSYDYANGGEKEKKMPNNTRSRSNALRRIAAEIIEREKIDVTNPPLDRRAYIREIAERGGCHIETARRILNGVIGSLRWGLPIEAYWGGRRLGAGRKPPLD